jgi:hypothetical protein
MLGLLNTVLSRGGSLLTYVKDGLVMANRFLTPPKLTFPVDASAEFNGTSDYIQLNEPFSHTNHTIAAWVNIDSFTSWNAIFAAQDSSSDGIRFSITSDSRIYYRLNNSSVYPADTISANNWYHIAVNYDGSTLKVYLDGSLLGDYSSSTTINNSTNATIGKRSDVDADRVDGNLANVAIWNRALSSDEINSVMWKTYEQVSTTESNGLQAWYKLSADEVLSDDSTATLTTYANANGLTFEAPSCVQTALNGLPDITDARLYSANYDIRVSADGGTVESLSCVETELNAIL